VVDKAAPAAPDKEQAAQDAKSVEKSTTMVDTGVASAKSPNDPGESKGTDTKDETAREFVKVGKSAKDYISDFDAPSGDKVREQEGAVDRKNGRENITNLAEGNSNHNTVAGVNPVSVAYADRPDYNPQRRPSSRANQQSSMGEAPQMMAARVDAKKESPTAAEIVHERRNATDEERDRPLRGVDSPYMGEI